MSCLINAGWKLNCPKYSSGIRKIYVIPRSSIGGYNYNTNNIITSIITNSAPFYVFEVPDETAELIDKQVTDEKTGIIGWETTLKLNLSKNNYLLRKLYLQLLNGKYTFIVRDGGGLYWIIGKNFGAEVLQSETTTGKVFGDFNGNKLTFLSLDYEPIQQVLASAFIASTSYNNPNLEIEDEIEVPPQD